MPTYEYRCLTCAQEKSEHRSVENRHSAPICYCGGEMTKVISAPAMVMPDLKPYKAVAGDQPWITSRAQHREFLRSNNLIEVGNEGRPPSHDD
jgi:putative FmdB family regulatory protein